MLLIAAIAFCFFWRRRRRAKGAQTQAELATSPQNPAEMNSAAFPTTTGRNENYGYWDNNNNMKAMAGDGSTIHTSPSPGPPPMAEMPPGPVRYEMDGGPHARAEMPGN